MPPETYFTIRQHADALTREAHPVTWRQHRNEPLDQLLRAVWLDQFGDETTPCLLSGPGDVKNHKKGFKQPPGRCPIRVSLWRSLPKGEYWVPSAVRAACEDEYLWQEMAALSWDDYDNQWRRRFMEQTVIPGSDFKQWKGHHWISKHDMRGRKKGSGSLASQDAPLIKKIKALMTGPNPMSKWAASNKMAPDAAGSGTLESKARRLHRQCPD